MIYIPANNNLCGSNHGHAAAIHAGPAIRRRRWQSAIRSAWCRSRRRGAGVERGHRAAGVDARYPKSPNWGAMLVTAGGLVFTGGTSDRKFHAFDAATGKLLWEFPMNSGVLAPPSSFSIDGKQYVAVETGWGGDSRGMQATLNNLFPGEYPEVPEGGAVWVFALE